MSREIVSVTSLADSSRWWAFDPGALFLIFCHDNVVERSGAFSPALFQIRLVSVSECSQRHYFHAWRFQFESISLVYEVGEGNQGAKDFFEGHAACGGCQGAMKSSGAL